MKAAQPFCLSSITQAYGKMIKKPDFTSGMVIIGLSYGMMLLYGMCSFLIEQQLHFSPTTTDYYAMFSGLSVIIGSTTSRILVGKAFCKKTDDSRYDAIAGSGSHDTFNTLLPQSIYTAHLCFPAAQYRRGYLQ
ncbi:hypothetical protein [Chitinophaga qingshengii]|uniref:MFS transporter n=1 Tax=Chitinophaga qingshengii TaxID=1569794 RepID=A0ABR7TKW2_9BACT|nr:hypothetical protein [Chitinophaga qingshengii]MBC9930295.1 hypothetical protein [Chitinophaga qingshengii]